MGDKKEDDFDLVEIDGSVMEGGGQILRMAMSLSALLKKPIRVCNIRARRSKPGLRAQHLMGIKLVADLCKGKLNGLAIGSTQIEFRPENIVCGNYTSDTGTAGSVVLLLQVALPCLLFANGSSKITLKGGTDAMMAPPIDYSIRVLRPILERFGLKFDIQLIKRGFYPKGGGIVKVSVEPLGGSLRPFELMERGSLLSVTGLSFVAGVLPIKMAHLMADSAISLLRSRFKDVEIVVDRKKLDQNEALANGSGITLVAKTSTGCFIGSSALGNRDITADSVGKTAANDLIRNVDHGGCVDDNLQDQLIIFMALSDGMSRMRCGPLTLHTQTAIHIAQLMTRARFNVIGTDESENVVVECQEKQHYKESESALESIEE